MSLSEYRESAREQERIGDLLGLMPPGIESALDVGARDGFISRLMADRGLAVTALDLETPSVDDTRVHCVKGDVTRLEFPDNSFDIVVCAEVLEHLPPSTLARACAELARVSSRYVLIGVPYRQDIRVGRTTCYSCGGRNPPWGHQNSFDEEKIRALFASCRVDGQSFVGTTNAVTNAISAFLMDLAGNPYGTYAQDEPCVHCGSALKPAPPRNFMQKIFTRTAFYIQIAQTSVRKPHANWIHIRLSKETSSQRMT